MQKILTIAGMHRSGTSLTAMWLHGCGLDLGDELMSGQFDNPLGHFEDIEMVALHENDLQIKGLKTNGLDLKHCEKFLFENQENLKATDIISKRKEKIRWGWKEPRSTLYLSEWKRLLPELKVLAIFRPYNEVVDSLVRRTRYSFLKTRKYALLNRIAHLSVFPFYLYIERKRYLNAWIRYNRSILTFKKMYPDEIIIIELEKMINSDVQILNLINDKFNMELEVVGIDAFYDKELLKKGYPNSSSFYLHKEKEAFKLQEQLLKNCDI